MFDFTASTTSTPASYFPPTPDVTVENEGSLFLFRLATPAAREWVSENVGDEATFFGGALVVEPRYAGDLSIGMIEHGLVVA